METPQTRTLLDRILPAETVHSAVTALRGFKVEERHHITLFGYFVLACSLLVGTFACRLLLL